MKSGTYAVKIQQSMFFVVMGFAFSGCEIFKSESANTKNRDANDSSSVDAILAANGYEILGPSELDLGECGGPYSVKGLDVNGSQIGSFLKKHKLKSGSLEFQIFTDSLCQAPAEDVELTSDTKFYLRALSLSATKGSSNGDLTLNWAGVKLKTKFKKVVNHYNGACATTESGKVLCWGISHLTTDTSIGDGRLAARYAPIPISISGKAQDIAASTFTTCAVEDDQFVECWGSNEFLGITNPTIRLKPNGSRLDFGAKIKEISGSPTDFCVLMGTGEAKCWGSSFSTTPQIVSALGSDNAAISVGAGRVCVLKNNALVYCLGDNSGGQFGLGDSDPHDGIKLFPVSGTAIAVTTGNSTVCVMMSTNELYCSGYTPGDGSGQSQIPVLVNSSVVGAFSLPLSASSDSDNVCVGLAAGGMACWGSGGNAQLGSGHTNVAPIPEKVLNLPSSTIRSIGSSNVAACAVSQSSDLYCWGYDAWGVLANNGVVTAFGAYPQAAPAVFSARGLHVDVPSSTIVLDANEYPLMPPNYCHELKVGLDYLGVDVNFDQAVDISFASDSGHVKFYSNSDCSAQVTHGLAVVGTTFLSVYVKGDADSYSKIFFSANGHTATGFFAYITPAFANALKVQNPLVTPVVDQCVPFTIAQKNSWQSIMNFSEYSINVSTLDSVGDPLNGILFSDSSCSVALGALRMPAQSANSDTFYLKTAVAGPLEILASKNGDAAFNNSSDYGTYGGKTIDVGTN